MLKYLKLSIVVLILISCFGQIPSANSGNEVQSIEEILLNSLLYTLETSEERSNGNYQRWRFYTPDIPGVYTNLRLYHYVNGNFNRNEWLSYKLVGNTLYIKYNGKEFKLQIGISGNVINVGDPESQKMFNTKLFFNNNSIPL